MCAFHVTRRQEDNTAPQLFQHQLKMSDEDFDMDAYDADDMEYMDDDDGDGEGTDDGEEDSDDEKDKKKDPKKWTKVDLENQYYKSKGIQQPSWPLSFF